MRPGAPHKGTWTVELGFLVAHVLGSNIILSRLYQDDEPVLQWSYPYLRWSGRKRSSTSSHVRRTTAATSSCFFRSASPCIFAPARRKEFISAACFLASLHTLIPNRPSM